MNGTTRRRPPAAFPAAAARILSALACLLLASTAGAARHEIAVVPAGKVLVRAHGGTTRNLLSMLRPIGTTMDVAILVVDGADARSFGSRRQVIVKPGHHELLVRCNYVLDHQDGADKGYLSFDFLADHAYEIDAGLPCVPRVIDKTAPVARPRRTQ